MTLDRGLDLSRLDVTNDEEKAEFRRTYLNIKGMSLPGYEFWLDLRPDQLKRARLHYTAIGGDHASKYPLVHLLTMIHYYSIIGFEEGIAYQVKFSNKSGATRSELLAALAVAFIHAGPRGMQYVDAAAHEYIDALEDDVGGPDRFPDNWSVDPRAFASGLDFSTLELSTAEAELLSGWYVENVGSVPAYVEFLGKYRPKVLKAYRSRFETSMADYLPKQLYPYMMTQFNVTRGSAAGIRESMLLGKNWGLTRDQIVDAICFGTIFGGNNALDLVMEAAGDVLETW
jgi:hypothetical protein